MDFQFSNEDKKFREEVETFLKSVIPKDWMIGQMSPWDTEDEEDWAWQESIGRKMGEKGWLSLWWPKEYGGKECSRVRYGIFTEEICYHACPGFDAAGCLYVAPTILEHGTEEQKRQYLPPIAKREVQWTESFTEREAGSDLASVRTQAVKDGDYYIIEGQKTGSSAGHHADFALLLARTDADAPKHKGLSIFIVDMKTPGITVRPMYNLSGLRMWNDVFFDRVRVPRENLIGKENEGWRILLTTLNNERCVLPWVGRIRLIFDHLMTYVGEKEQLRKSQAIRNKLASLAIEIHISRLLGYNILWRQDRRLSISHEVSIMKCFVDDLLVHVVEAIPPILGLYGQLGKGSKWAPFAGTLEQSYLNFPVWTLANGAHEVEKTVIATLGLGLRR